MPPAQFAVQHCSLFSHAMSIARQPPPSSHTRSSSSQLALQQSSFELHGAPDRPHPLAATAAFCAASGADEQPKATKTATNAGGTRRRTCIAHLAFDPDGNVIACGDFTGEALIGTKMVVAVGVQDAFAIILDAAAGTARFGQAYGGIGGDSAKAVAVSPNGGYVLTGVIGTQVDFGGGLLPFSGTADIFVARFSQSGVHQWSQSYSSGLAYGTGIALSNGRILLTGTIQTATDFGMANVVNVASGFDNGYVVSLAQ
jgi:hypothetical protein